MKKLKLKNAEYFREEITGIEKDANNIYDKVMDATTLSVDEGDFLLEQLETLTTNLENLKKAMNEHNNDMNKKIKIYFWLKTILWALALLLCFVFVPLALITEVFALFSIFRYHDCKDAIIDEKTFAYLNQEMMYVFNNLTTSRNFAKKKSGLVSTDGARDSVLDMSSTQMLSFESPLIRKRNLY